MTSKTVTIFGVFDGIHEGHWVFIEEAKKQGDRLVGIVARDSVVTDLKGKAPVHDEVSRIKNLLQIPEIDLVYLGDLEQGTYNIIKEIRPDVIYLGYDQKDLFTDLNSAMEKGILSKIDIVFGEPHKPEEFKSSILNKKNEPRD
jgi:FAD synthetase